MSENPVTISNWRDFFNQFGNDKNNKSHRTAPQIHKLLGEKIAEDGVLEQVVDIPYQDSDLFVDTGICLFSYKTFKDGKAIYEYTGTAK